MAGTDQQLAQWGGVGMGRIHSQMGTKLWLRHGTAEWEGHFVGCLPIWRLFWGGMAENAQLGVPIEGVGMVGGMPVLLLGFWEKIKF